MKRLLFLIVLMGGVAMANIEFSPDPNSNDCRYVFKDGSSVDFPCPENTDGRNTPKETAVAAGSISADGSGGNWSSPIPYGRTIKMEVDSIELGGEMVVTCHHQWEGSNLSLRDNHYNVMDRYQRVELCAKCGLIRINPEELKK